MLQLCTPYNSSYTAQLFLLNNMNMSVFSPMHTFNIFPFELMSRNKLCQCTPCGPLCTPCKHKFHIISSDLLSQNRLSQCTPCGHSALLAQNHRREVIETYLILIYSYIQPCNALITYEQVITEN
jgi:DNA-directed RNA polymerase subunit RPC12/RpoP